MKKGERLVLRVDEGLMERVRVEAGVLGVGVSEWVRGAIEGKLALNAMDYVGFKMPSVGVIPEATPKVVKVIKEPVLSSYDGVPDWKLKLAAQQKEFEEKKEAVPSVVTERPAVGIAALQAQIEVMQRSKSEVAPMKLMPQMVKPVDFHADEEPDYDA